MRKNYIEITVKNIQEEIDFIGVKTLDEYIKSSRIGRTFSMNRKQRKYLYSNRDMLLKKAYDYERKASKTISKKGLMAYDAITKFRDEVMLITA